MERTQQRDNPVDLSKPDNSEYIKERSSLIWALWILIGSPILRSEIIPVSGLKVLILRIFGAKIGTGVYIKPGVKVKFPWLLTIGDHCWIGEDAWIDNLTNVIIGSNVCVSQGAYICTGNHDWKTTNMRLFSQPIRLEDGCWIGARAIVSPGVTIGRCSIAALGSVVAANIPAFEIWSGNPAGFARKRVIEH